MAEEDFVDGAGVKGLFVEELEDVGEHGLRILARLKPRHSKKAPEEGRGGK